MVAIFTIFTSDQNTLLLEQHIALGSDARSLYCNLNRKNERKNKQPNHWNCIEHNTLMPTSKHQRGKTPGSVCFDGFTVISSLPSNFRFSVTSTKWPLSKTWALELSSICTMKIMYLKVHIHTMAKISILLIPNWILESMFIKSHNFFRGN